MTGRSRVHRVLQVHTRYRQAGGEDEVVTGEKQLLERAGIEVHQVTFDNADLHEGVSLLGDLRLAGSAIWSRAAGRRIREAISEHRPQVAHVHNTFSAASPSVVAAAAAAGVPVVHTLHNYRLVCPVATLFRDGHVCTDCVGRAIQWPAVVHRCVRASRPQSLVVAATNGFHRARGTFHRDVSQYIALTQFQREWMIEGGLPSSRITVVPNSLSSDPGQAAGAREGLLFAGRLSVEKGIGPLLSAAALVPGLVAVAGDGPYAQQVQRADTEGLVTYLGHLSRAAVAERIGAAIALVVPSVWFEGFPLVLLEAFARGTPVIASRIGSLAELVEHGKTGLLAEPGDPRDLAERMTWASEHPGDMGRMGATARERYEERFDADVHLTALVAAYETAMDRRTTIRERRSAAS